MMNELDNKIGILIAEGKILTENVETEMKKLKDLESLEELYKLLDETNKQIKEENSEEKMIEIITKNFAVMQVLYIVDPIGLQTKMAKDNGLLNEESKE